MHILDALQIIADGTTMSNLRQIAIFDDLPDDLIEGHSWQLSDIVLDDTANSADRVKAAQTWAEGVLPRYRKMWRKLGQPASREQWLAARN
jgi:hypothetical protein